MNRNTESHFSKNPTIGVSRSKFDRSFTHKTTFNAADLIPIFVDTTIMPGDTVKMRTSEVVRMATPICPVMDNANLDLYFFFVPYRLIWDHWKAFMGENETAPWIQQNTYTIPMIRNNGVYNNAKIAKGSIADYMGYPTDIADEFTASALPFRAYGLIWNEFFRDQNLQNPVSIYKATDATLDLVSYISSTYDEVTHAARGGGKPLKVCKYHDYFTSCLPGTQKGPSVTIPLSNSSAPVLWNSTNNNINGIKVEVRALKPNTAYNPVDSSVAQHRHEYYTDGVGASYGTNPVFHTISYEDENTPHTNYMAADLSNAIGATVTQLRQAFAIQKFYEKQALGGSRYIEMIKTHFDVTNPDFRMQRPEYLGGKRIPINMNQVVQNTPTDGTTTPLGTTGAFSVTSDRDEMFTHSFTEHGILMGLCAVRTVHTYQQGLNRQFSKKNFTDFYFPVFANLSNQAVLNKEIYLQGNSVVDSDGKVVDEQAFGYQEAWATERYFPDIVTGEMRSNYAQSLDVWHYADYYTQKPTLGDKWIEETKGNIDRTLAVQTHDQFIADFYFAAIYTRPMPLYSIPGLIDHH